MGDPRKQRKKYETPNHPWQGDRIKAERKLMNEYGLKNKKELWKMSTLLKGIKTQAKSLITREDEQAKKEKELFLNKLSKMGLIKEMNIKLEDILGLDVNAILGRRLQTILHRKGLAKTAKQARQFIIHGHVAIKGSRVDVPSYLVPVEEESAIEFSALSTLSSTDHPERQTQKTKKEKSELKKEFKEAAKETKKEEVKKE